MCIIQLQANNCSGVGVPPALLQLCGASAQAHPLCNCYCGLRNVNLHRAGIDWEAASVSPCKKYQSSRWLLLGQQFSVDGCDSAVACGSCQGWQSSGLSKHRLNLICTSQALIWLVSCLQQKRCCLLLVTGSHSPYAFEPPPATCGCRGHGIHLWSCGSKGWELAREIKNCEPLFWDSDVFY